MLENLITVMWVYMSSLILIHIPSHTFTSTTSAGRISPRKIGTETDELNMYYCKLHIYTYTYINYRSVHMQHTVS